MTAQRSRLKATEGMTIVEVIMAILLLAVGTASLCQLSASTIKLSNMSRLHYQAENLCKNRLEDARVINEVQGLGSIQNLAEIDSVVNDTGADDSSGNFRRNTTVSNVSPTLLEVIVNVQVKNSNGGGFNTNECEEMRTEFATNVDLYCVQETNMLCKTTPPGTLKPSHSQDVRATPENLDTFLGTSRYSGLALLAPVSQPMRKWHD